MSDRYTYSISAIWAGIHNGNSIIFLLSDTLGPHADSSVSQLRQKTKGRSENKRGWRLPMVGVLMDWMFFKTTHRRICAPRTTSARTGASTPPHSGDPRIQRWLFVGDYHYNRRGPRVSMTSCQENFFFSEQGPIRIESHNSATLCFPYAGPSCRGLSIWQDPIAILCTNDRLGGASMLKMFR